MISNKKKIINNISSLKKILNKNKDLISEFYGLKYIRISLVIAGTAVILFCLSFYFLGKKYGSFINYPSIVKIIFLSLSTIIVLTLIIFKFVSLKSKKQKQTILIKKEEEDAPLYTMDLFVSTFPQLLLAGLYWYIFSKNGLSKYVTGTVIMHTSIICFMISRLFRFKDLFIFGLYIFIWGTISILFLYEYPLLIISLSFGAGWLFWGFYLFIINSDFFKSRYR